MPTLNGVKDMTRKSVLRLFSILFLAALLAGCSSAQKSRTPSNPDPLIKGEVTEEKARRALEMKLTKQIEYQEQNKEYFKTRVVSLPADEV
jgi:nitrous oxide reductase accessory protein NosL